MWKFEANYYHSLNIKSLTTMKNNRVAAIENFMMKKNVCV